MAQEVKKKEPEVIFVDINPENPVTKIQSMCMECGEEGTTSFLLTSIPHFREIIVSSFECPACGAKNNAIQFGGSIQPKGIRFDCKILKPEVRFRFCISDLESRLKGCGIDCVSALSSSLSEPFSDLV